MGRETPAHSQELQEIYNLPLSRIYCWIADAPD